MTKEKAQHLIHFLRQAQQRPGMFFPCDESGVAGFLSGIHTAKLTFFSPHQPSPVTEDILRERGWQVPNSLAPWAEMKQRHYTIDAIIEEVLTIEIETLRRLYKLTTDGVIAET